MVAADRVEHRLAFTVLLGEVHADLGVAALHLLVHRLADVVQEPAARAIVPSRLSWSAKRDAVMMLAHGPMRVTHVTTHCSVPTFPAG